MAHALIADRERRGALRRVALLGATFVGLVTAGAARTLGDPPPGLLRVAGGSTWIGTEVDELERLAALHPTRASALFDELERYRDEVGPFDLMATEVTNEQFAVYARATLSRPPVTFCPADVLAQAQRKFVEVEGRRYRDARASGAQRPERKTFDPDRWWDVHWREHTWRVPPGQHGHPVRSISFEDARAYAAWVGLRLMTELEYQHAARGSSLREFAFAGEFDAQRAASIESTRGEPVRVGSFPATGPGFFDLAGNVWELTSSAYVPYPNWSVASIDVPHAGGRRLVQGYVPWDANQRIVVGGSAASEALALRISNRRPIGRGDRRDLVGFRCAGSLEPVRDRAGAVLSARPAAQQTGHSFDPERAVGTESWLHEPGEAPVPGYALITGYDALLALPAEHVEAGGVIALRKRTRERGPVPMAFLHQTLPSIVPALPGGDFVVLFRGAGKDRSEPGARDVAVVLPNDLDLGRDQWLFVDRTGRVAAHLACESLEHGRNRAGTIECGPDGSVRYELSIPDGPASRYGFRIGLDVAHEPDRFTGRWRTTGSK